MARKSSTYKISNSHVTDMIKLINKLAYKHSSYQIFNDFLELSALSISNAVDLGQYDKREARYMEIVEGYDKEELAIFPELLADLVLLWVKKNGPPTYLEGFSMR